MTMVTVSDQRGTVLQDIINKDGNDRYKYYYHDPQHSAYHWSYFIHC